jgi:hypothetical protein
MTHLARAVERHNDYGAAGSLVCRRAPLFLPLPASAQPNRSLDDRIRQGPPALGKSPRSGLPGRIRLNTQAMRFARQMGCQDVANAKIRRSQDSATARMLLMPGAPPLSQDPSRHVKRRHRPSPTASHSARQRRCRRQPPPSMLPAGSPASAAASRTTQAACRYSSPDRYGRARSRTHGGTLHRPGERNQPQPQMVQGHDIRTDGVALAAKSRSTTIGPC